MIDEVYCCDEGLKKNELQVDICVKVLSKCNYDEYGSCYTDIALILKAIELEYRRLGLGCVKLL